MSVASNLKRPSCLPMMWFWISTGLLILEVLPLFFCY